MTRVKCRGLKMDDLNSHRPLGGGVSWERSRWATLRAPQTHRYASLHTTPSGTVGKRKQIISHKPSGAFTKNPLLFYAIPPSSHSLSVSLSLSFSFRIVTIVPFTLPVDWSLLSRPTNQAGLRHLCKPSSQWRVSLRGRRLNNAGGTPRRLSFSLLLPVSFHVGPDFFLN